MRQPLVYVDVVKVLGSYIRTVRKYTDAVVVTIKEIGVEVNAEKSKCMFMWDEQNLQQKSQH
jgi:hypothetical protein